MFDINDLRRFYNIKEMHFENDKSKGIHIFTPKIRAMLQSNKPLEFYQKTYNLQDKEIYLLNLFLNYFDLNTAYTKKDGSKNSPNPMKKSRRVFNPKTLVAIDNFNKNKKDATLSHKEWQTEGYRLYNELTKDINIKQMKDTKNLFADINYEDKDESFFSNEFVAKYIINQLEIGERLNKKITKEGLTIEQIRERYKEFQKEFSKDDELLIYIRKKFKYFQDLVSETTIFLRDIISNSPEEDKVIIKTINFVKRYSEYLDELLKSPKKNLQTKLKYWNNYLESAKTDSLENCLKVLQWLVNEFELKKGLRIKIMITGEWVLDKLISNFSKIVLKQMIKHNILSKEEIRAFIYFNIGLKDLSYRRIDTNISICKGFLNTDPEVADLLIARIINRGNKEEFDEKLKKYFSIYPYLKYNIRDHENEMKKQKIRDKKNRVLNNETEKDNEEINDLVDSFDENIPEEIDDSDDSFDENIPEETDDSDDSFDENIYEEIDYPHDSFDENTHSGGTNKKSDFEAFKSHLTVTELQVAELMIDGKTQQEISDTLGYSQPYISKVKKQIKEKINRILNNPGPKSP